ncbi:trissin [Aphomia sociella]
MLKITAVVSLMLIAMWTQADTKRYKKEATASAEYEPGSTLWAASLSCDSCGSECASACGTRHFRSCCFNYLRRKRGPETLKFPVPNTQELKTESAPKTKLPIFLFENVPEPWSNLVSAEYRPYDDDRLQIVYDI